MGIALLMGLPNKNIGIRPIWAPDVFRPLPCIRLGLFRSHVPMACKPHIVALLGQHKMGNLSQADLMVYKCS